MTDIAWTTERKAFLRECWSLGYSGTVIGKMCSARFHEEVSKNAAIGKVHRLQKEEPGWDARPSPIRRRCAGSPTVAPPVRHVRPAPLPALSSVTTPATFVDHPPPRWAKPPPAPRQKPPTPLPCLCPGPVRTRRSDGSGCLYPIGDPGSPQFRYCDGDLYNLAKPYCDEHRRLAYTKVQARKPDREEATADYA